MGERAVRSRNPRLVGTGLALALCMSSAVAHAFHPAPDGNVFCEEGQAQLEYVVASWASIPIDGENADIRVEVSYDFGPWTEIDRSAFIDPVYEFSGIIPVAPAAATLRLRASAQAPWRGNDDDPDNDVLRTFAYYANSHRPNESVADIFEIPECEPPAVADISLEKYTKVTPPSFEGDLCPAFGKASLLTLAYTGSGPEATSHSQAASAVSVAGDPAGASPVRIVVSNRDDLSHHRARVFFDGTVAVGETFDVTGAAARKHKVSAKTFVFVFDDQDELLQSVEFHTSCSQPLHLGDEFGSIQLRGFRNQHGAGHDLIVDDGFGEDADHAPGPTAYVAVAGNAGMSMSSYGGNDYRRRYRGDDDDDDGRRHRRHRGDDDDDDDRRRHRGDDDDDDDGRYGDDDDDDGRYGDDDDDDGHHGDDDDDDGHHGDDDDDDGHDGDDDDDGNGGGDDGSYPGDTITWTYVVSNPGDLPLTNVVVTDDNGTPDDASDDFVAQAVAEGTINVGDTNGNGLLDPGEEWVFNATGSAIEGQYRNLGVVTASPVAADGTVSDDTVRAEDVSHYSGQKPVTNACEDFSRLTTLTLSYTGDDNPTSHHQSRRKVKVYGSSGNAEQVYIVVSDKAHPQSRRARTYYAGEVNLGETFLVHASRSLKRSTYVHVYSLEGERLQKIKFHTSCSQPLYLGDQFGSVQVAGVEGRTPSSINRCGKKLHARRGIRRLRD